MFRKDCSLCGGKLDSNNICKECGLDNRKSDANYVLNQSECDDRPLTHVHENKKTSIKKEKPDKKRQRSWQTLQNTYSSSEKYVRKSGQKSGKKFAGKAAVIVVILSILGELLNFIPEEGESYSTELWQGEYVVGVHIPEGIYHCTANGGYASFDVRDEENSIWLYEWVDEDQSEYMDLRLYEGAVLEVLGDTPLQISTANAQVDMEWVTNPLEGSVYRVLSTAKAGKDFEPGVYHLHAEEGYGQVVVEIMDEGGAVIDWKYIWMDAHDDMESNYMNLVLPEGAVISWEDYEELEISLIATQQISTEDYLGYYGY